LVFSDWARVLLWEIWQALGGGAVSRGEALLTISCPVRGLVSDNRGRRIGFVGDSLVNEVPGAEVDTSFEIETYRLPDSLHYTVATAAYDTGRMDVCLLLPVTDSLLRLAEFDSVPLGSKTKATFSLARGDTSFSMQVDWDGNGQPDTALYPDFNDTLSLRSVGVTERQPQALPAGGNRPLKATVVRGAMWLGGRASAILTDIAGRKVADLHPGENDLRVLAPGVYFVTDRAGRTLHRVLLQR
jgi:hypothetical protein